jgi:hypothetical protein
MGYGREEKTRANLLMNIEDSHLHYVSSLKTFEEIWDQIYFPNKGCAIQGFRCIL